MNNKNITELEKKIGYSFKNCKLLLTALTHTSYANEHSRQGARHNERLEFLGDSVLEVISSEFLFKKYPDKGEGELSKLRASMVSESPLAIVAAEMGLPEYLRLGKGEETMGGRSKASITSDAVEALIGAIYLDGGLEEAKNFVYTYILLELDNEDLFKDSKTRLQEIVQNMGKQVSYVVVCEEGPDHDKTFTIEARIDNITYGTGVGRTKKTAAQAAAKETIHNIETQGE